MRGHARIAVVSAMLVLVIGMAGCTGGPIGLPTGVVYPKITPVDSAAGTLTVTYEFTFEGAPHSISVDVDGAVYAGADAAEKSVTRFGNARENDWIEDYYPAFVQEAHQDAFYEALLAQFRALRSTLGLDADRYVELLTVFAQSIEYRTDPVDLSPKFPIETFVDKNGDCDDKTLLLGGLLSREGYDVAVLLFEPEQHVALGIASTGDGYRGTGYDLVETTAPGFVGMVPDGLGGGIDLVSEPRVFRLDGGTTAYGASEAVAYILERDARLEATIVELGQAIAEKDTELQQLEAEASSLKTRLDSLSAAGDTAAYNALVPEYNAAADAYNATVAERNALAARHNEAVEARAYIYDHLDDRVGVLAFLQGQTAS